MKEFRIRKITYNVITETSAKKVNDYKIQIKKKFLFISYWGDYWVNTYYGGDAMQIKVIFDTLKEAKTYLKSLNKISNRNTNEN